MQTMVRMMSLVLFSTVAALSVAPQVAHHECGGQAVQRGGHRSGTDRETGKGRSHQGIAMQFVSIGE